MPTVDESWWVRVLAGPGGELHATESDESYVILPRASDPRAVVDRSSPLAVRDAVERFVASRTGNSMVRSMAGRTSTLLAKTTGAWSVAPSPSTSTLRRHLSDLLGQEVRLSVSVGPPRPNRKPVIRCYNEARLVAVAKLGPDPHTAEMVLNESRWLRTLTDDPLEGMRTPVLLHEGVFGDAALLVMDAMNLESDLGVGFTEVPLAAAREFSDRHRGHTLRESGWWLGLPDRLDRPSLAAVKSRLDLVTGHPEFDALEVSAWHGDWSPWNIGREPDGGLVVWDWERATIGVPVGFDVVHLHYQYGAGLGGADDDLRSLGVPDRHHDLVKELYLFEVCARLADAEIADETRQQRALDALLDLGSGTPQ